jgi:hypothetical protein
LVLNLGGWELVTVKGIRVLGGVSSCGTGWVVYLKSSRLF